MEIKKELQGSKFNISLVGRLDAISAGDLDKVIQNELNDVDELTFDFSGLDFVASAGLRVLLVAQKRMNKQGTMKITNVNEDVMDVLEMTGFSNFLDIVD
ncbi:anti-sigma F factor antagonist (stage II sporulation protein AA) [Anaerovibrio sp. JC8]|uniref:STAS domain-containing protein n=1 Tax=Anaerovibrio sp. JC8 TaxID=1240085 RepID=UPI000A0CFB20|nr:STAS domain-containing protein [Anaerovibrio sp. JC8]ORU00675.1 anti-sigma F factor antagonist (stage II sporulation protein AA) [Anaerovibrio sp. JC8]